MTLVMYLRGRSAEAWQISSWQRPVLEHLKVLASLAAFSVTDWRLVSNVSTMSEIPLVSPLSLASPEATENLSDDHQKRPHCKDEGRRGYRRNK